MYLKYYCLFGIQVLFSIHVYQITICKSTGKNRTDRRRSGEWDSFIAITSLQYIMQIKKSLKEVKSGGTQKKKLTDEKI